MSNPSDHPPGTVLTRLDGYTATVVSVTPELAVLTIQPPTVRGRVPTPQQWEGDPADLANCWNVAPP